MRDSPFFTDEFEAEKLITSAESLFWANSKDNVVLVLFSKNKLCDGNVTKGWYFFNRTIDDFFKMGGRFKNELNIGSSLDI